MGLLDLFFPLTSKSIIGLLAAVVVVWLTMRWRKRFQNTPPTVGTWIPFIGAIAQFGRSPPDFLRQCYDRLGETFGVYMFGEQAFFLNSPEGLKTFFTAREDVISARHAYRFTVPVFGPNVVYDVDPEVLVEQKKFLKDGFTSERFRAYADLITKETEDYFEREWGNSGTAELLEAFNQITVFTSTLCLQGREVREKFTKDFADLYNDLDAALDPIGFFFPNIPLPAMWRRDGARKKLNDLFKQILEERKGHSDKHDDFISTLTNVTYKASGRTLSEDEVIGLVVALLLAGQHTSNVTSTWMLLMLISNPDVMAKVMKEQDEITAHTDRVGYEQIEEMKYLEACMKETLRVHPPLVILFRRVLQDFQVDGQNIPAGSLVGVSPILIHTLPRYWENPDKFDPSRHLGNDLLKDDRRYAYIGFGAGRHQCSGETFAYLQVKTILSVLLRRYKVELVGKFPPPNYKTMVVSPVPPVTIRYTRREN